MDELEKENRELEERNKMLLVELQRIQKVGKSDNARRAIAYKKAMNIKLSEAQTRELIDEQLRNAGWEADTAVIRYSKGIRPANGLQILGRAIAGMQIMHSLLVEKWLGLLKRRKNIRIYLPYWMVSVKSMQE